MWQPFREVAVYFGLLNKDGTKNSYRCTVVGATTGALFAGITLYTFRKPLSNFLAIEPSED